MSSRRSRPTRQSNSSRITEEQINDLVSKLQAVLPEARLRSNDRASASKVLQETCNYIRSLHREVDDLSERLSELLETTETISSQADIIRSLLMSTRIEAAVPSPLDCLAYSFMVGCRLPSAN